MKKLVFIGNNLDCFVPRDDRNFVRLGLPQPRDNDVMKLEEQAGPVPYSQ